MITLNFSSSSMHAVEELRLSIENADYMVRENVVSFVAAVVASGPADFEYTVTVETLDDTAVGKRVRSVCLWNCICRYMKLLPIITCVHT